MKKYFVHSHAIVETQNIGKGTRIWAFSHVLPGAVIGDDCNLCDHTFIENDVVVGDRVTVKSGVQLWDGIILGNDVFIGPNATFTNDLFPRSKKYPTIYSRTTIRQGASIGANATILPGITIGQYAMVGAGTVVIRDVPPYAIVVGNPARIIGYVHTGQEKTKRSERELKVSYEDISMLGVGDVALYKLPHFIDMRGSLTFAEVGQFLPFLPKRFFLVFDVPSREIRGEHAHRTCHQFLVCVKGSCSVVVDDGHVRAEVLLNSPSEGIFIPPMIWATEYNYTSDAVLLVMASDVYNPEDYIRDYDLFLREIVK